MRRTILPLLLLAAACSTGTETPLTPGDDVTTSRFEHGNADARREQVARRFARALARPDFRAYIRAALDTSTAPEGKIAVDRFLSANHGRGRHALAEADSGTVDDTVPARLEMYFPVPEHRTAWRGDDRLLVGTIGADGSIPVAFTLQGRRVALDPDRPPPTPVLAVVPRETDFSAVGRRDIAFAMCTNCDGGGSGSGGGGTVGGGSGGGGGGSTGVVPGLYLTQSHLNDTFESWLKGAPEVEISVLGQKGSTDSLTTYQCINERAVAPYRFNQDDKDWSGSALLMSQAELDNFKAAHPGQALRLFFVEDDDTPCVMKASQTDIKAIIQAVDALVKGLAGGSDVTTWYGKVWKYLPVVQQLVSLGSSIIKTSDDLIGNAVEDVTTTERHTGYNWVIKGKNAQTNGYISLEMR
jgi:hypothetical protein